MIDNNTMELVVVDDDDMVVELIRRMLIDDNCKISGFTVQEKCLAYLSNVDPTYLFVDMRMPKMDGLEFITTLKKRGFSNNTKIFLCSGATPTGKIQSLMFAMDVDIIDKGNVCDKAWLRSTLGFSDG